VGATPRDTHHVWALLCLGVVAARRRRRR
jgi:MYXO-CTERM domain-containing protein